MDIELSEAEKKAIRALKRVAKSWPDSLWLYSASGTLYVMRQGPDGMHAICSGAGSGNGIDPDYVVDQVEIENDGGDW